MVEVSAAFDLCLVRKIRNGLRAKGKADPEIDAILDSNRRLEDRAKKVLKEATGKSLSDVDNTLWAKFLADRKRRGSVAHTDMEPLEAEATSAVEDTIKMIGLVDGLPS
jgi:hypothetical protein